MILAGVLDGDLEGDVGRDGDRIRARVQLVARREDLRALDGRPSNRAGGDLDAAATDPLEDGGEVVRADELGAREEVRVRHERATARVRPGHSLPAQLAFARVLELVVPDDVAREQALHLRGEDGGGAVDVLGLRRRGKSVCKPVEAADPKLKRLDRRAVLVDQPAGRRNLASALDIELLLAREAGDAALERRLLHACLEERAAELPANRLRR